MKKILIFSRWNNVLKILSKALISEHILHLYCKNNQKLQQYSATFHQAPEQILLLPIKKAGFGLNLLIATHVYLMEPLLDKALELQAINRVHRIGQVKKHMYISLLLTILLK